MIESPGVEVSGKAGLADTSSASYSVLIPEMSRQIAPALAINDIDGKPITLAKYKGKVVLLDFWAVNCGGCKLEIPWYVQFDQKYHREGLRLIGIDMYEESISVIKPV